jgi:hypothetical protein
MGILLAAEAFEFGWLIVVAAVPEGLLLGALNEFSGEGATVVFVGVSRLPAVIGAGVELHAAKRTRFELDAIAAEIERVHCIDLREAAK